ncbi:MAG TPA: BrnA antitoxin family protein [Rhodopila sp.]|uniref:BrnA antitoxin family protein n=1 Tax=Rhodopila sp. TaxID=2480087 RepID=UPI002C1FA24A|nr:BrnA antitoxin family protein [Rhodopila sp.]HVY16544.1 BrnA antitoxin family protein [Rhodopila sp.]
MSKSLKAAAAAAKSTSHSGGKSRSNGTKAHARPAAKSRPSARMQVDTGHGNWATDLVFDVREPKLAVSLRLDADVLRFFRGFGSGYQTRINEVLKAFMHARSEAENGGAHALPTARMVRSATAGHSGKRAR